MPAGNWGAVRTLIEGFIAHDFLTPSDQGVSQSIFVDAVRLVATRADLTEANIRVYGPAIFDGTNDVTVSSAAAKLIAVVAQSNASAANDSAVLFYNAAVTEGTTKYIAMLAVPGGGSAATASIQAVVYPRPVQFSSTLRYSVVDNTSDTTIEGTGLIDASGVKVMVVYAV